jgi:hypothetical protein
MDVLFLRLYKTGGQPGHIIDRDVIAWTTTEVAEGPDEKLK